MRITMEADYAIRILYHLSKENMRCDSGAMAEKLGIPKRYCLKILHALSCAGLVCSYPGKGGGYELAVSPALVTLRRIIELIDGPICLSRCQSDEVNCTRVQNKEHCMFHCIFAQLGKQLCEKLDRITLSDVINPENTTNEVLKKIQF